MAGEGADRMNKMLPLVLLAAALRLPVACGGIRTVDANVIGFLPTASAEANATASRMADPLLILHLDFNTIQMKKETVVDCLRNAAAAGYNAVLWEIENKVRWACCPECVHPEAFTKDEFRGILAEADRLGLRPIPLMQTFGGQECLALVVGFEW